MLCHQLAIVVAIGGEHFHAVFNQRFGDGVAPGGQLPLIGHINDRTRQALGHPAFPLTQLLFHLLECRATLHRGHGHFANHHRLIGRVGGYCRQDARHQTHIKLLHHFLPRWFP